MGTGSPLGGRTSVFVVIVSWNGARWIGAALDSLRANSYPVKIVVVDNASGDETVQIVRDTYPEVHFIALDSNIGFGKANNIGLSYALKQGAHSVFLLNQDARVHREAIAVLVGLLERSAGYGILSPVHLNGEGNGFDRKFLRYLRDTALVEDLWFGREREIYPLEFVNAAAWLVSRECFLTVGGFDPLFFAYGEDDDYCSRALFHGFRIGVVPRAMVYHDREQRMAKEGGEHDAGFSRVEELVTLKDVRRSFGIGLWRLTMRHLESVLLFLRRRRMRQLVRDISELLFVLSQAPRVWQHRRICYKPGAHWLSRVGDLNR